MSRKTWAVVGVAMLGLCPTVFVGCGPGGPPTYTVTGTVSVNGESVQTGSVVFFPSDGKGPTSGGQITDGTFEFESSPGEKRVEISGTQEMPGATPDAMPDYVSIVPPKYNTESTLTAKVQESGDNVFTFDLESQ